MPTNDSPPSGQPRGFRFKDQRQERIFRRLLELVGPGPAEFYRDACRLIEEVEPRLASTSHLVAHLLRETESALRDVLETIAEGTNRVRKGRGGTEKHAAEIRAILSALGIPESDPFGKAWLALAEEEAAGLARRAHRNALAPSRGTDREFLEYWDKLQAILDLVLTKAESMYLRYLPVLDGLLARLEPTPSDLKQLRGRVPNNVVLHRY